MTEFFDDLQHKPYQNHDQLVMTDWSLLDWLLVAGLLVGSLLVFGFVASRVARFTVEWHERRHVHWSIVLVLCILAFVGWIVLWHMLAAPALDNIYTHLPLHTVFWKLVWSFIVTGLVIWLSAAMWFETFRETDGSFEWASFPGFIALVLGGFYPAFIFLRYLFVGVAILGPWTLTGVLTLALCAAAVAVFVMILNWANPR